jgi:hypothetical protein
MSRHLTLLLVATTLTLAGTAQAQNEGFPNTKAQGRAAVEYEDDAIHLVAAYYYSQRNHDSRWLLVEAAVSTEDRMTIHRDSIRLVTPDGVEITLAGQKPFSQDIQRIRLDMQNARTTRHGIGSYFNRQRSEEFRFFQLPGGPVVYDNFVVDNLRVAWGDLFFESPTGSWEDGVYTLVIEHEGVRAAVPIGLE